jgi:hypothetical protein
MLREHLVKKGIGAEKDFHWRSHEILRFEGFSDAVFAFAVTFFSVIPSRLSPARRAGPR